MAPGRKWKIVGKLAERHGHKLVEEIKKRPFLYDTNDPNYNRKLMTNNAWAEIGNMINLSGPDCKDRWQNIRGVYCRHLRNSDRRKPYYLYNAMEFIKPYLKCSMNYGKKKEAEKPTTTNEEDIGEVYSDCTECQSGNELNDEASVSSGDASWSFTETTKGRRQESLGKKNKRNMSLSKKKKKHEEKKKRRRTVDPVASFLNSLEPELNEMNVKQLNVFEKKVNELIDDIMNPCYSHIKEEN